MNDELNDHDHLSASRQTPHKADAFVLSEEEKIEKIQEHVAAILDILASVYRIAAALSPSIDP